MDNTKIVYMKETQIATCIAILEGLKTTQILDLAEYEGMTPNEIRDDINTIIEVLRKSRRQKIRGTYVDFRR